MERDLKIKTICSIDTQEGRNQDTASLNEKLQLITSSCQKHSLELKRAKEQLYTHKEQHEADQFHRESFFGALQEDERDACEKRKGEKAGHWIVKMEATMKKIQQQVEEQEKATNHSLGILTKLGSVVDKLVVQQSQLMLQVQEQSEQLDAATKQNVTMQIHEQFNLLQEVKKQADELTKWTEEKDFLYEKIEQKMDTLQQQMEKMKKERKNKKEVDTKIQALHVQLDTIERSVRKQADELQIAKDERDNIETELHWTWDMLDKSELECRDLRSKYEGIRTRRGKIRSKLRNSLSKRQDQIHDLLLELECVDGDINCRDTSENQDD
jgi:chromosome segregation ATPase